MLLACYGCTILEVSTARTPNFACPFFCAHLTFVGIGKEAPIVTPLMDYVRQKRASKGGSRVLY